MPIVEAERKAPVRLPVELVQWQPFALERIEHRVIPGEDVRTQPTLPRDDRIEEVAQRVRIAIARSLRDQAHAAVDVPAEDEDGPACLGERRAQRGEISVSYTHLRAHETDSYLV